MISRGGPYSIHKDWLWTGIIRYEENNWAGVRYEYDRIEIGHRAAILMPWVKTDRVGDRWKEKSSI